MPQDFTFDFTFAGERYNDTVLTWGLHRPRRKRSAEPSNITPDNPAEPNDLVVSEVSGRDVRAVADAADRSPRDRGVGWTIDVPDVLRMLDAVRDGRATVDDVDDLLRDLTQQPSQKSGCCVECDDSIEHFESLVQSTRQARARFDDSTSYPFLVTQNAIHNWDCYHFAGHRPEPPGRTVSEFVHGGYRYCDRNEISRLSPDEATAWMDQRVGPKGAQKWRRCKTCQPALPGAWTSQSNDVPTGPGQLQR